ncbi:GNAT family N-acetyltransferase, partial [Clostridium perfringens]
YGQSDTSIGMIRVNCLHTNTAIIHDFCVLPAIQGRGYGREILSRVVKLLQSQEYSQIRLSVVTQNRRALSLYQSIGFDASSKSLYYVIPINNI